MNFKTTILLIICLAIAGIAVYFTHNQTPTEPAPETPVKLIDLPSTDVTKIVITPAADQKIVFEKQGANWQMLEPVNALADSTNVDELVSSLTNLESHGKSDASGANADVTGLNSPRFRVELTETSGKTIKLAIGKPTGVGDELYVQKDGDSQADRVAAGIDAALNKPASSFRDLKLLDVKSPEIKTIQIAKGGETVGLNREGNNWQVATGPTTMPADESEATDLALGISGLRATEFVSEKSDDPKRYGLDDPQTSVQFTSQPTAMPGTTKPSTEPTQSGFVKFGRYQDLRKLNVYVQTSASPAIAIVPAASMTKFDKKPLDLRDKNVLKIDKDTVESISIETNKPATTQPTTRAAEETTLTIVHNKQAPTQPWHAPFLPPGQSASSGGGATTQASTNPTMLASTQPTTSASTQPATMASTEPATQPAPLAEMGFHE